MNQEEDHATDNTITCVWCGKKTTLTDWTQEALDAAGWEESGGDAYCEVCREGLETWA